MIAVKIDVTKLDKSRFFKGSNGAIYCDLVLFENDRPDKFGNEFSVKQSATKEERAAKKQLPFVGNGKYLGQSSRPASPPPRQAQARSTPAQYDNAPRPESGDIPF